MRDYVEVEALAWKIYDDENILAGNFAAVAWTDRSDEDKRPFRILARSALDLKDPHHDPSHFPEQCGYGARAEAHYAN